MPRTPKAHNIEFHEEEWDDMLTGIVQRWAVPKAEGIADAANRLVRQQVDQVLAQGDSEEIGSGPAFVSANRVAKERSRKNRKAMHVEPPEGKRDYMVSVEGSNPLNLNDYRATVITVTERAKIDNARNNTLIRYLGQAGGNQ